MDFSKDMGIRYMELAERIFAEYDYVGAKKLSQKAKDFFPELNLISTFITVIDIYLSREKIVDGQPDWYGILGLEKSAATPENIFERCKKLFNDIKLGEDLVIGVEGAKEIIAEACAALTGRSSWIQCPSCLHKFSYYKEIILNNDIFCTGCGEFFHVVSRSEYLKQNASNNLNEDDKCSSNRESVEEQPHNIRKSSRTIVRPLKYKDFICY